MSEDTRLMLVLLDIVFSFGMLGVIIMVLLVYPDRVDPVRLGIGLSVVYALLLPLAYAALFPRRR